MNPKEILGRSWMSTRWLSFQRRLGLMLGATSIAVAAGVTQARAHPPAEPWSAVTPQVARDLTAGRPPVIQVVVRLCSNAQIDCGASWAGQSGRGARSHSTMAGKSVRNACMSLTTPITIG